MNEAGKRDASGISAFPGMESFLLAIDTAAVLLPVKPQFFGCLLTFPPTCPEILIVKWNTIAALCLPSYRADQFVVLTLAVEESGAEGVEAALLGKTGSGIQTHGIADQAAVLFAERHLSEEILERVVGSDDQRQALVLGKLVERLQASFELLVWMDVGIEKETMDLPTLGAQSLQWDDGARAAARVQKYPRHG
jgi:hypothetical protein